MTSVGCLDRFDTIIIFLCYGAIRKHVLSIKIILVPCHIEGTFESRSDIFVLVFNMDSVEIAPVETLLVDLLLVH